MTTIGNLREALAAHQTRHGTRATRIRLGTTEHEALRAAFHDLTGMTAEGITIEGAPVVLDSTIDGVALD